MRLTKIKKLSGAVALLLCLGANAAHAGSILDLNYTKDSTKSTITSQEILQGIDPRVFSSYGAIGLSQNPFDPQRYVLVFDSKNKAKAYEIFAKAYSLSGNLLLKDKSASHKISGVKMPQLRQLMAQAKDNRIVRIGNLDLIKISDEYRDQARRYLVNPLLVARINGLSVLAMDYLNQFAKPVVPDEYNQNQNSLSAASKVDAQMIAAFIMFSSGDDEMFSELFRYYMGEVLTNGLANNDSLSAWKIKVAASYARRLSDSHNSLEVILSDRVLLNDTIAVLLNTQYDKLTIYNNAQISDANETLAIFWQDAFTAVINSGLKYNRKLCNSLFEISTGDDILKMIAANTPDPQFRCQVGDMLNRKQIDPTVVARIAQETRKRFFSYSPLKQAIVLKMESGFDVLTGLDNSYEVLDIFKNIRQ